MKPGKNEKELLASIGTLRRQLAQTEAELTAIRYGETVVSAMTKAQGQGTRFFEGLDRFQVLLEAVPDAIIVVNNDRNIVLINHETERLFGYTREELVGHVLEVLLPERLRRNHVQHRRDYEADPRVRPMGIGVELIGRRKDGSEFPVEVSLSPIPTPEGLWVISTVRDITQRQRAEGEIQRLNAELERRVLERTAQLQAANEDLEAFSYSVSHDLRTPLATLDSLARLLLDHYGNQVPQDAQRWLHLIHQNAVAMNALIEGLLTFARTGRQELKTQTVATADLVRQVLEDLRPLSAGRKVEIHIGDLPPCQADPVLLKQVWVNLLSNAFKFTRRRETAQIEIGYAETAGEPAYFVRDNGVGFDMENAAKLFGVFQRLHSEEEYEGTGVGLAIVARIVRRHGGHIWAAAELDKGTTFSFTLPPS